MTVIRFDPQPPDAELPERMPSPFAPPHPVAQRAAEALQRELRAGRIADVDLASLEQPGFGKMFGVLVVAEAGGGVGYLRGFSGMLDGKWEVDGFAPPTFDQAAKAAFWPAFEAQLDADDVRVAALQAELDTAPADRAPTVRAALLALQSARADRSRENWQRVTDTYRLQNARGEIRTVTELFAPHPAPGAAGDCAGPKLLAQAYRHALRPIAFAEFWWGAPSTDGERLPGAFYPACDRRCRVVLPFMLEGLEVEPMPPVAAPDPLEILYEDAWLLVVVKPAGLPSKPGGRARDSLLSRLRRSAPTAALAFTLAQETAGVIVAAKDAASLAKLQRRFGTGAARIEYAGPMAIAVELDHPETGERRAFRMSGTHP